jgi:cyclophilin family peptidyl-prolyl cis-trans isomerase
MGRLFIYLLILGTIIGGVIYAMDWDKKTNSSASLRDELDIQAAMLKNTISSSSGQNAQPAADKLKTPPPSSVLIDQNKNYAAVLHTSAGDIFIQLDARQTPVTVNNFVYLAGNKFYDNTVFHRVIKGFMIQGGDPLGNGTGGPDYKFADEKITGKYTRGTVAMANAGPNTNGSQFFILQKDYPLQPNYVIFGKVVKGIEVVDKIADAAVNANEQGEKSQPVDPVVITSVEVGEIQ